MDAKQEELWRKLAALELDAPGAELTFVERLARECGWSRGRAQEVVHEYRRFLLLAATAGHPVTPSEEVDQAWHLHLAYSVSYWEDLCGRVLGRALHHGPTRGGRSEGAKFRAWYAETLRSYERVFGAPPPAEVWPEPARRFAPGTRFRHVDTRAYWLLPRRWITRGGIAGTALLAGSCALTSTAGNALLLALLAVVVVVILVAAVGARRAPRRARGRGRAADGTGCGFLACGFSSPGGGKHADGSSAGMGDAPPGDSGCGSGGSSGCGASGCGGGGCGGGGD